MRTGGSTWGWPACGEIDIFEHHSDGGPDHYAARAIKSLGYCDGGDWQSKMLVLGADLDEFHEYSVEWAGDDLVFRLDGEAVYRLEGEGANLPEPMFAILNFAFRMREYGQYPTSIFNGLLRFIFTYVIPIGFMAFYQSQLFLRPDQVSWLVWLSPLVGFALFALAYQVWTWGVNSYTGTGS